MSKFSMQAVERALSAGETVRLDGVTIRPPTRTQAASEEVEYAAFVRAFGWESDGEPEPTRLVTMPKAEYDEMVKNAAMLPELVGMMRQRPAVVTPEEEAEYQQFASRFGWE